MAGITRFYLRIRAFVILTSVAVTAATIALVVAPFGHSPFAVVALTATLALPVNAFLILMITKPVREIVFAVSNGLLSLLEKDFTIRLTAKRRDEAGEIARRFNALGEMLRREHNDIYQQ